MSKIKKTEGNAQFLANRSLLNETLSRCKGGAHTPKKGAYTRRNRAENRREERDARNG